MIRKIRLMVAAFVALFMIATPLTVAAADEKGTCGGTQTHFIKCDSTKGVATINELIKIAVNVLTVLIGILAVGGLAYAGVLYASAQDNQSQVSSAMTIIRNVVIGLFLYGFTIAIINWLIPGGVIG